MREAEHSVNDARATDHAISFSYALHRAACPVALWNGDLAAAGHYADMLLDHASDMLWCTGSCTDGATRERRYQTRRRRYRIAPVAFVF
jgi:hypothetical protein